MDDFDRELELENAGIDAFDFSIMDEDERREVLEDAGLNYADYEYLDLNTSFSYWSDLQDAGLSLHELQAMDEDEQREALEAANLFPGDYGIHSPDSTYAMKQSQIQESRTVFNTRIPSDLPFPIKQEDDATSKGPSTSEIPDSVSVSNAAKQQRREELRRINSSMRIIRYAAVVLILLAVVVVYAGIQDSRRRAAEQHNFIFIPSPSDPVLHSTSTPVSTPSNSYGGVVSAPYIGKKLSRYDDDLYFLGGGDKIGGVSTSKYRYSVGSKTYVVYLDNDYVIKKIEDYLPNSSSKSSSSGRGKTSDPYRAKDYSHPDDFYYDNYDDFWDYEEAEDYWEEYG